MPVFAGAASWAGNFQLLASRGRYRKESELLSDAAFNSSRAICLGLNRSWCFFSLIGSGAFRCLFLYGGAACPALDAIQKCCFLREGPCHLPAVLLSSVCRCVLSCDDKLSFAVLGWEMHSFPPPPPSLLLQCKQQSFWSLVI